MSIRKSLEGEQYKSLQFVLKNILPTNKFYKNKLRHSDLDQSNLETLLKTIPFTTKQELVRDQQNFPPYGTNLTYSIEEYIHYHQTSASSGSPLRWLDTKDDWEWISQNWMTVFTKSGVTKGDRIFFAFSFGPFLGFWSAFYAAQKSGLLAIPGGGMSSVSRLHMIAGTGATVLCCTPTYAIRLGEVAKEEKIDLKKSKIQKIIVAGEPGGSITATREKIKGLWPESQIIDHHGMTEVGPVSYQLPDQEGILRIMESRYIAEIIEPETLLPVKRGSVGELVLTTLGRIGSPLLRYRTGDLVKQTTVRNNLDEKVDIALEGGILGRSDDSVSIKGVNVYPGAFEQILRMFEEITEYRVLVNTTDQQNKIKLQIEADSKNQNNKKLIEKVQKQINATLSIRIPIILMNEGELPRFEMKSKRWILVEK